MSIPHTIAWNSFFSDRHLNLTEVVTTHVVRLKAEGVRKEGLPHFGGETAGFRIKHGFKVPSILAFPNSLQPLAYPPE
jgi:hypothetical protein